jgi:hypothetical protein
MKKLMKWLTLTHRVENIELRIRILLRKKTHFIYSNFTCNSAKFASFSNRKEMMELLGFERLMENSYDAIAGADDGIWITFHLLLFNYLKKSSGPVSAHT